MVWRALRRIYVTHPAPLTLFICQPMRLLCIFLICIWWANKHTYIFSRSLCCMLPLLLYVACIISRLWFTSVYANISVCVCVCVQMSNKIARPRINRARSNLWIRMRFKSHLYKHTHTNTCVHIRYDDKYLIKYILRFVWAFRR